MELFKGARDRENNQNQTKDIVLTYAQVLEPDFVEAIMKCVNAPGIKSSREIYNLAKMYRRLKIKLKDLNYAWRDLLRKFAVLDDKGQVVPYEGKEGTFEIKEGLEEDFKKAEAEFNDRKFILDCYALNFEDMNAAGSKLTAKDVDALGDIIMQNEEI